MGGTGLGHVAGLLALASLLLASAALCEGCARARVAPTEGNASTGPGVEAGAEPAFDASVGFMLDAGAEPAFDASVGSMLDAGAQTDAPRAQRPDEVQARFARLCAGRDSSAVPAPGQWTGLEAQQWPGWRRTGRRRLNDDPTAITPSGLIVTLRVTSGAADVGGDGTSFPEIWANVHVPDCGWLEPVQLGLLTWSAYPAISLAADGDRVLARWEGPEHELYSRFDGEHWTASRPLLPREVEVPSTSPPGRTLAMDWYDDVEVGPGAPFAAVPKLRWMEQVRIEGGFAFAGVHALASGRASTELWFGQVRGDDVVVHALPDVVLSVGGEVTVGGFLGSPDEPHFALAATPSGSEALLVYADVPEPSEPENELAPQRPVYVRFLRNGAWTEPERIAALESDPSYVVGFTAVLLDSSRGAVSWGHMVEEQGQLFAHHYETRSYREGLGWGEPGAGRLPNRMFGELGLLSPHRVVTLQVPDGRGGWEAPLRVDSAVLDWGPITLAEMAALPFGGWLLYGFEVGIDGNPLGIGPARVATWSPGAGLEVLAWLDPGPGPFFACDTSAFGDAVCWTEQEQAPRMTIRVGAGPR